MGPFDSTPIVSCQLPVDTYGLSLTILSYLAGSRNVSSHQPAVGPSDPDTMTNTALEAIVSSSGNKQQALSVVNDITVTEVITCQAADAIAAD